MAPRSFLALAAIFNLALATRYQCSANNATPQADYTATFTYQGTTMTLSGTRIIHDPANTPYMPSSAYTSYPSSTSSSDPYRDSDGNFQASSGSSSAMDADYLEFYTNTYNAGKWLDIARGTKRQDEGFYCNVFPAPLRGFSLHHLTVGHSANPHLFSPQRRRNLRRLPNRHVSNPLLR